MKTRHLLGSLLVAGALVAVGLWLSSGTVKAPQPQVSEATSCAAPANDVHTLPGRSQVNEAPPKNAEPDIPPEPPPAPLDNDPAAGRVWLRVVDADTQQPLADTQVELFPAGRDNNGSTFGYLNDATRPAPRRTDAEGRLALTVSPLEGEPDEDADVAFDDFARQASRLYVPVPPGWYPLVGTFRLGLAIYELTAKPTDAPIDVPVRRFASLTVNVRDQSGVPVSDAQLRLNVLTDSYEDTDWHDVFSGLPRAESRLFSPPKEDAVERELLPRQIVCKWNGEEKTEAELQEEMEDGDVEDLGFRPVGSFGTTEFDALPRLTVVAFAWHRLYGVVSARMDLGADANTLEVVFPNTRTAELHVRVNWSPKPDNPEDEIEVMLTDSGPYGRTGP